MKPKVHCSIVIPVYCNERSLRSTLTRIQVEVVSQNPQYRFEVVFVDDGSPDGSLKELLRLNDEFPKMVRIVQLSRNFGQVKALLAGYAVAEGECTISISADEQDPVFLMNEMLKGYFEEKKEIVVCQRIGRCESIDRRLASKFFYFIMQKLTFPNMPLGGFDYLLMGARMKELILKSQDAHLFLQGHVLWSGYSIKFIPYQRQARKEGKSRWTFAKKIAYLIDGVTAYSFFPIRAMSLMGLFVGFCGFTYAAIVLLNQLIFGNAIKGWTPLMIVILLMGGFQAVMLGGLGEYIWRILAQVRKREPFIIEQIHGESSTTNFLQPTRELFSQKSEVGL